MKRLIYAFVMVVFNFSASASYNQAPPSFAHKDHKAIFVDFDHASYVLNFDNLSKLATVESTIDFTVTEEGYPIFDLVPEPLDVTLNGLPVKVELTPDLDNQTQLRVIQLKVPAGTYQLKIKHVITENVVFNETGVASAFWLSDLNDRGYLEKYIPSNVEFDHYPKKFHVNLMGFEGVAHTIKANGKIDKISDSEFEITYPETYTSSSVFFHLFPEKAITKNVSFYYTSIDGRKLPVDIYSVVEIEPFVALTKLLLAELEIDYGPFPHDQVLIYGTTLLKGGMEYSGATATGLLSLGHELFHSYNARGIMPANGNAGWMDEGMARWRDNMYRQSAVIAHNSAKLAGHSIWRRSTDRDSYAQGSAFLAMVAHKMNLKGMHLKDFLRDYFQRNMFTSVTTQLFEKELIEATGIDFSGDFNRYIYGRYTPEEKSMPVIHAEDPHHPEFSKEELLNLTMPKG